MRICEKHRRALLAAVLSTISIVACSGGNTPPAPPDFFAVPHPTFNFSWFAPGAVTATAVTAPAGWVFHKAEESFAGAAWIVELDDLLLSAEISHATLWARLNRDEAALRVARGRLAPGFADNVILRGVRDVEGRDRLGLPVVARLYEVELPQLSDVRLDFLVDWAAQTLGGRGQAIPGETGATGFQWALGLSLLHNGLAIPQRTDNDRRLGVYGVWAVIPNRIAEGTDFLREGLEAAQAMPYGSRFARVRDVQDELRRTQENTDIGVIYVVDPLLITEDELPNIKGRLLATMLAPVQDGVNLNVAMIRGCDTTFASPGIGGENFVSSASPGFESELNARLELLLNAQDCGANELYRAAATAVIQAGTVWQSARQRWIVFVSKRDDVSPCVDVPQQACRADAVFAFIPDDVRLDLVAPTRKTCNETDLRATTLVPSLAGDLAKEGGRSWEYCDAWGEALTAQFQARASGLSGLRLSKTPLPNTLQIRRNDTLLAPGTITGYTFDRTSGVVVPGSLATFTANDTWRATYRAVVEPTPTTEP